MVSEMGMSGWHSKKIAFMSSRKHYGIVYVWSLLIRLISSCFVTCVTVLPWTTSGFANLEARLSTSSHLPKQSTTQSFTEHRRFCDVAIQHVCYPQSSRKPPAIKSFSPSLTLHPASENMLLFIQYFYLFKLNKFSPFLSPEGPDLKRVH